MPATRTPYLLLDLDAITRAYDRLAEALPEVTLHYAMKCPPTCGCCAAFATSAARSRSPPL